MYLPKAKVNNISFLYEQKLKIIYSIIKRHVISNSLISLLLNRVLGLSLSLLLSLSFYILYHPSKKPPLRQQHVGPARRTRWRFLGSVIDARNWLPHLTFLSLTLFPSSLHPSHLSIFPSFLTHPIFPYPPISLLSPTFIPSEISV